MPGELGDLSLCDPGGRIGPHRDLFPEDAGLLERDPDLVALAPHHLEARVAILSESSPEPRFGDSAHASLRVELVDVVGESTPKLDPDVCQGAAHRNAGRHRRHDSGGKRLQLAREIASIGIPPRGILLHAPIHDALETVRKPGVEPRHRRRRALDDGGERLGGGLALERDLPRRHLVEDEPERELIRSRVGGLSRSLFGRHVLHRSDEHPVPRAGEGRHLGIDGPRGRRELGETEVQNLDETVLAHHDVLRLQIPVHDAGGVRLGETVCELACDLEKVLRAKRSFV